MQHYLRYTVKGLFYKCYNEDAVVFVERVKAYKVTAKFFKSTGEIVYSMGLPVSEAEKGNLSLVKISEKIGAKKIEVNADNVVFILDNDDVKGNNNIWAEAL